MNAFFSCFLLLSFLAYPTIHVHGKASAFSVSSEKHSINGAIQDPSGQPIPYASIAVYNTDSTLVSGSTSDEKGQFSIGVKPGNYYLKITFLSYQPKVIPGIHVEKNDINLGKITLVEDSESLEEVVVEAEKSEMMLKLDKRVFNVGKDLSNAGGSASELLDNVPSVTVDVEGNVSLRGSQNVRVLIDGKPSGLTQANALRQLPGNMIERIEVITNPSSKYEAEGEAGIINIILKKEKKKGINGSFEASAGYPDNYAGSFNLNFRRNFVNLFATYGIRYRKAPGYGSSYQEVLQNDSLYVYERDRQHVRGGLSNNIRVGADFFLNDKNTITLAALYQYSDDNNTADIEYRDLNSKNEVLQTTNREDEETEIENEVDANLRYKKTFDEEDREWTVDLTWIQEEDSEDGNLTETTDVPGTPILYQKTSNIEDEFNYIGQTDYIHPFAEDGKFEAGLRSSYRRINNNYKVEQKLGQSGEWQVLPQFNNNFVYTEIIHAAYLMLGNKWDDFSYQLGLRSEYSDITTELKKTGEVNNRDYLNFFPSVHLSYELNSSNTLQTSYSRRISRPSFWNLLPFFSFSDSRNFFSGNPDLNPEYTDSYELGYLNYFQKGSLLSSIYYRYRTGVIDRITTTDSIGFTRSFPVNLAIQNAYGIEFNYNYRFAKWWNANANFNFYRAITEGEYEGQELFSDTYTWTGRVSTKITLFKKLDAQLSGRYRAPRITTQGRRKAMYSMDAGLSMSVLKKKGDLTFSVRDIFNSRVRRSITETATLYSESEFQWRVRQFILTFTYRLNQKKRRGGESPGGQGGENGGEF